MLQKSNNLVVDHFFLARRLASVAVLFCRRAFARVLSVLISEPLAARMRSPKLQRRFRKSEKRPELQNNVYRDIDRGRSPAVSSRPTFQQQQRALGRFYLADLNGHALRAVDVPSVRAAGEFQSYRSLICSASEHHQRDQTRQRSATNHIEMLLHTLCGGQTKSPAEAKYRSVCQRAGKSGKQIERTRCR